MKKNLIFGIVGGVLAVVGLVQTFGGIRNADIYNDYVDSVRPLIEKQDALLSEIQSVTDEEGAKRVKDWLTRSRQIETDLKAVKVDKEWISALHAHMLARGDSFTKMVQSAEQYFATGDELKIKEMEKNAAAAAKHLDAFLAARDQVAKDKDFEIKE